MYELVHLEVSQPNGNCYSAYHSFIPDHFLCCLHGKDPGGLSDTTVFAIGATQKQNPVGIVLASYHHILHHVYIHHLFVDPSHRNRHIGRRLLERMKEKTYHAGGRFFFLNYELEDPTTPALEKVLQATEWKGTRPYLIRCLYDMYHFDMPWLHRNYPMPEEFQEFSWTTLTDQDRNQLQQELHHQMIPLAVSPFFDEERLEPINSLGLRYKGRVVGWMLTHRIAPDTICYTALYVDRSFHFSGIPMKLLSDSIHIHLKNLTPWGVLEIPLLQVHSSWIRFAKRRLIPYATKVTHIQQAWDVK